MSIDYTDLILGPDGSGIEWVANGTDPATGLDCKGLSFLVLRRCGIAVEPRALLLDGVEFPGAWDDHAPIECWEEVGAGPRAAKNLGDLLVCSGGKGLHVMPLVDDVERLALSIDRGQRGVRAIRVDWLGSTVEAVLRYRSP